MTDLIERLRSVKWEVTDDCGRMPDDPTHECVFVDMRPDDFRALLEEAAAALEAAREDGWQPIETCPNESRVVMFCDERQNIWTDCAWDRSDAATGFYATHWRPLPAPPAIDQARGTNRRTGNPIRTPRTLLLACSAIEAGIQPIE